MAFSPSISAGILGTLKVPAGTDVYDAIMGGIEPDLLTVNLTHLKEKYASETSDQHAARMERYRVAYEKYDAAFAQWVSVTTNAMSSYKRDVMQHAENVDRNREANALTQLEQSINTHA